MAAYYFCNGTTVRNLPCQLQDPHEGDKCHFHDGGGGPGPKKIASAIFIASKSGIDAICYLHAASEAVPFAIELANKGISMFGSLVGLSGLSPTELADIYEKNEKVIIDKLSFMDEKDLREISAVSNFLVSMLQEDEGRHETVNMAAN